MVTTGVGFCALPEFYAGRMNQWSVGVVDRRCDVDGWRVTVRRDDDTRTIKVTLPKDFGKYREP